VSAVFDSPRPTVGPQPNRCVQRLGLQFGDETDGFVLATDMLAGQQGGRRGEGKAAVFSSSTSAFQRATLSTPILLERPCPGGG